MEQDKLKSVIESLLFASGEPVKISRIVKITESPKPEVENAIMVLSTEYSSEGRGLTIIKKENEVQLATDPENSKFVDQMVKGELQEDLSTAALEVLSIIAYRGPITRSNIELIRGVNCSYTLRNLLMRGLIERVNNPNDARGYIYKISFELMKKLGIDSVEKLPEYKALSKDERVESIISQNEIQE